VTTLSKWLPYFPGGYTYATRCGGLNATAGYLLREWAPFLVVLPVIYGTPFSATLALLVGWQGFYECGYLFNDLSRTAGEPGGARLDTRVDWRGFALIRVALLGAAASVLCTVLGTAQATIFVSATIFLLVLSLAHTVVGALANGSARIGTFAALSVYKYAPLLVPVTGLSNACVLLLVLFLAYGQARVALYVFRKHPATADTVRLDQDALQAALLVALSPLVLELCVATRSHLAEAAASLWTIHLVVDFAIIGARKHRHRLAAPVTAALTAGK
jgi:hypothetical protein